MKNLILSLVLIFGIQAQAESLNLKCITKSVIPTTTFIVEEKGDRVELLVVHHNGAAFAPFWDGLVVPNDMELLMNHAAKTIQLGDRLTTSWPKSKCRVYDSMNYACIGQMAKSEINGVQFKPWGFTINDIEQRVHGEVFKRKRISFAYDADGLDMRTMMDFEDFECEKE